MQTEANRLAESEAALQRKAALYDRLARGEGTEAEEVRVSASVYLGVGISVEPDQRWSLAKCVSGAIGESLPGSRELMEWASCFTNAGSRQGAGSPPGSRVVEAVCGVLQEMYHVDFLKKGALAPPDADELSAAANTPGSRAGIGASRHTGFCLLPALRCVTMTRLSVLIAALPFGSPSVQC